MIEDNKPQELTIDTALRLFTELRRRKFIVIAVIVLSLVISYAYAKLFIKPTYRSVATLHLINAESDGTDSSELSTFSYLANDFVELIPTNSMVSKAYENVKSQLSTEYRISYLLSHLTVAKREGTRVIDITVTLGNSKDTKILADSLAETSCKTFTESYKKDLIEIANKSGPSYAGPNYFNIIMIGAFVGIVISLLVLFVFIYANDKISGSDDAETVLGVGTLATIPYNRGNSGNKGYGSRKAYKK